MFTVLKNHLELPLVELAAVNAPLAQALIAELTKRDVKYNAKDPIGLIPMVRQLIEESRLDEVIKLAQVSSTADDALRPLLSPEAIDDDLLQSLVSESSLTEAEASSIKRGSFPPRGRHACSARSTRSSRQDETPHRYSACWRSD